MYVPSSMVILSIRYIQITVRGVEMSNYGISVVREKRRKQTGPENLVELRRMSNYGIVELWRFYCISKNTYTFIQTYFYYDVNTLQKLKKLLYSRDFSHYP